MEILNLQIQLKAIEVQCLNHVPQDVDPDLLDSIETWKAEWSTLKRRKARKTGGQVADHESFNSGSAMGTAMMKSQSSPG